MLRFKHIGGAPFMFFMDADDGGGSGDPDDPKNKKDPEDSGDPEDLGEAGKKALAAERAKAAKAEREKKAADKKATELQAKLDEIEEQNLSDQEKAVTAARDEGFAAGKKEATEALMPKILEAEVKAVAADKLAISPSKAVRLMDLQDLEIGEDGSVDEKAITAKVDELLEAEPHLKKDPTKKTPDVDGGARSENGQKKLDVDSRLKDIEELTGIGSGGKD